MSNPLPKVFRDPIIAFAIVRFGLADDNSVEIVPLSVSWDGTCIHGGIDQILAVYPAQSGTYSVHGYIDDIPEEEIWLGYELPGADTPDWEEVLTATTYEIEDIEDDGGEMHSVIVLDKPSRVDMRIMAMKPKKKRGRPKKQTLG